MFQQVTLIGNLGSDVELRYTPSGTPVASFSLAVNKTWTDPAGERQGKTTWFRVTCWRKLAEATAQHLSKGRQVLVVGEVEEAHPWTDQTGNLRASLEVTAQTIRFLGSKNGHGAAPQTEAATATEKNEDIPF